MDGKVRCLTFLVGAGHNGYKVQELATMAWAFATAGQSYGPLFAALAGAARRRSGDFNPQELTNTAWAFAKARLHSPGLFLLFWALPVVGSA